MYLDLPKGAKWLLKGVNSPSLRVQWAPLGRCWYVYTDAMVIILEEFVGVHSMADGLHVQGPESVVDFS